jgi:hypothetical protein
MKMADARKPVQDAGDPPEDDMQALIREQAQIRERQEQERVSRGLAGNPVASSSYDQVGNPVADRLSQMEAAGAPPYLVQAEKRSMEANRAAWAEQLDVIRSKPLPGMPSSTISIPGQDVEMLNSYQQEAERILMARIELAMENPPRHNGATLEEMILNDPDETVPGGYYIVNNQKVDASGRVLA